MDGRELLLMREGWLVTIDWLEGDLKTALGLLDARFVAGDEALAADLIEKARARWQRYGQRRLESHGASHAVEHDVARCRCRLGGGSRADQQSRNGVVAVSTPRRSAVRTLSGPSTDQRHTVSTGTSVAAARSHSRSYVVPRAYVRSPV